MYYNTITSIRRECAMSGDPLAKKVRAVCAQDAAFGRAHRMVVWMMLFWAFTVIVDRGIGMLTNAYEQTSAVFPLAGAAILLLIAFLGTRGHLTLALLFLELNMAGRKTTQNEYGGFPDPVYSLLLFL